MADPERQDLAEPATTDWAADVETLLLRALDDWRRRDVANVIELLAWAQAGIARHLGDGGDDGAR